MEANRVSTRSEADVAASVIAVLLDQHIISAKPDVLRLAADKVGVTVDEVRRQWHLLQQQGYRRPNLRLVDGGKASSSPAKVKEDRPRRWHQPPHPSPVGTRWCRLCKEFHRKTEFVPPRLAPNGSTLKHSCVASQKIAFAQDFPEWLSEAGRRHWDEQREFIKLWLEGRVAAGEHIECPKCRRGVKAGEETRLVVTLEHVDCEE